MPRRGRRRRRRRCPRARRGGRSGCGSRRGGRGRTPPPWRGARPRRRRRRCGRSRGPAASRGPPRPRPRATCSRAEAANAGVIQLKKTPSNSAPANAHIFGPIAASTSLTPGSASRSAGRASLIAVSGFLLKPAPTPSHSRSRSRPSRSMWPAISAGSWRSSAITATPRSRPGAAFGERRERLQAEAARVVVGPHRGVAQLGAAGRKRPRHVGVQPGGDSESRSACRLHPTRARAAPRTRRAASAGTCRRA